MKTNNLIACVVIFFATIVAVSCKKDKKPQCDVTVANLVGSYKITAATTSASGIDVSIFNSFYDPCEQDDIYTLNADMSAVHADAGTKCSLAGDGTSTWSLSGNTITIAGEVGTITSFDCSTVIISTVVGSSTIKVTYTKQ